MRRMTEHGSTLRRSGWRALLAIAASFAHLAVASAEASFETPPVLRAADLAPAPLLQGPHFHVEDEVPTDGFLAAFTIHSDVGTFLARGPGMLAQRVHEVGALLQLDALAQGEVAKEGLKEEISDTGTALSRAARQPGETVKGLPAGVGRFFKRVGRAGKTTVQEFGDLRELRAAEAGSHTQVAVKTAKAAGRATADVFGYDDARRALARQLAIDPYTTNEVLYRRLDEVARAGFAGKLSVTIAKSFIPGSMVLSATTTASDWVWDTPPGELEVMIDHKLRELGAAQDEIDRLLRHPSYTLSYLAMLLAAMKDLEGISGLDQTASWVLTASSYEDARFIVNSFMMLAEFHREKTPIESVRATGPLVGQTLAGELVAMGPVDYLSWTEDAFVFARRTDLEAVRRSLWITGRASPRARAELANAGWLLHERVLARALEKTTSDQESEPTGSE